MADTRTIRVVLEMESSGSGSVSPSDVDGKGTASDAGSSSKEDKKSKTKEEKNMERFKKSIKAAAVSFAVSAALDAIGSYYALEENYKAQVAVKNIQSAVNFGQSLFGSTMVGMKLAGPAGAAIMTSITAARRGIEVGKAYISEAERLAEMAYNKRYKSEALGLIDGSRGTEN